MERQRVLVRGPEVASARHRARGRRRRGRREAELEHASQAVHVEHVGGECRSRTRPSRASAPYRLTRLSSAYTRRMRVHGKGAVEERRREAPDHGTRLVGLLLQRRDVAQGVDAPFTG